MWLTWLDLQWDRPTREDVYQMQVACEVRRGYVKNPRRVNLKDFFLDFGVERKKPKLTKEQAARVSKARWVGMMGMAVKVVTKPPAFGAPHEELADTPIVVTPSTRKTRLVAYQGD